MEYLSRTSKEFAFFRENAIIYETYEDGLEMHFKVFKDSFDIDPNLHGG